MPRRSRSLRRRDNQEDEDNDTIVSPTNRTNRLNRSKSRDLEELFKMEREMNRMSLYSNGFNTFPLIIYTDGSYNRQKNCSGIGIFVGPGHELNRSQRIIGPIQDSNYAELIAIKTALENVLEWRNYRNQPIIIRTDSIRAIESLHSNRTMRYDDDVKDIKRLIRQFPRGNVLIQHVYSHSNSGNEMAHTLASLSTSNSQNNMRRRNRSNTRN